MTTSYYTASSIDGFIADPANSLSWLLSRDVDTRGPMGYEAFAETVGVLAMGSTTYRWVVEHELAGDPSKPWPHRQPTWVFSTREVPQVRGDVRVVRGDVAGPHADMVAAAGGRGVWVVGGGDLAGQFADAGLLDEVWVQYAPVALGGGAPLLPRRLELRLEEVARNRDFACARYTVLR
ncbi:MAG TPA: dihydrofolate reductase family protein [Mycobacteriales bacterium]|nr:dihydrofolate reductase family protein [Mycobacteriales bacterium]